MLLNNPEFVIDKCQTGVMSTICYSPTAALPMWSNGQTIWAPCAVERDDRSGRGSIRASARARPPTKRIISNNAYAHDDQGDNPGQENILLDGVLYKL